MRILFAGTPANAATVLTRLLESHHEVVGVLTQPDAPTGRGRTLKPSAVAVVAHAHGLPLCTPPAVGRADVHEWIAGTGAQMAVVVAYGQILDARTLSLLPQGWFNLHFSLLPAYRGAAPVQRSIEDGLSESGVSIFRIDEGLDTGPLAVQVPYRFDQTETAGEALTAMTELGADALVRLCDAIDEGELKLTEQASAGASYAAKLRPSEARIDAFVPAAQVSAHIRAFSPAPGAYLEQGGTRVKVLGVGTASPPAHMSLAPGQWGVTKKHLFLGTATDPVEITWVAPAGRRTMRAADWSRGARLTTGDMVDQVTGGTGDER